MNLKPLLAGFTLAFSINTSSAQEIFIDVNETEINYSFNFVGSENLANDTLSLSDNIKEIAKKDQQRKAFLSLYFDNILDLLSGVTFDQSINAFFELCITSLKSCSDDKTTSAI